MEFMFRITALCMALMGIIWPSLLPTAAEERSQQPSAKERLNQVLDPEGGIQVYKDHRGNVESTINLPNGERIIKIQPPASQGFNVGPPLQLNNQTFQFPQPVPPPAQPPAPDFPEKAR